MTKSDRYGPVTGDPLGVALPNHTPIERPAQGISFGAGLDSLRVQLLTVEPLARPAGLTCAKKNIECAVRLELKQNVQSMTIWQANAPYDPC